MMDLSSFALSHLSARAVNSCLSQSLLSETRSRLVWGDLEELGSSSFLCHDHAPIISNIFFPFLSFSILLRRCNVISRILGPTICAEVHPSLQGAMNRDVAG